GRQRGADVRVDGGRGPAAGAASQLVAEPGLHRLRPAGAGPAADRRDHAVPARLLARDQLTSVPARPAERHALRGARELCLDGPGAELPDLDLRDAYLHRLGGRAAVPARARLRVAPEPRLSRPGSRSYGADAAAVLDPLGGRADLRPSLLPG